MCGTESPLLQHADLRILAEFHETEEWVLEPGDAHPPPRLAHCGVAVDNRMTYSVGFRAPSAAEVLTHFTDFLGQFLTDEERYMTLMRNRSAIRIRSSTTHSAA
jgi:50S ribosomal protein L16 3-hydroxylase